MSLFGRAHHLVLIGWHRLTTRRGVHQAFWPGGADSNHVPVRSLVLWGVQGKALLLQGVDTRHTLRCTFFVHLWVFSFLSTTTDNKIKRDRWVKTWEGGILYMCNHLPSFLNPRCRRESCHSKVRLRCPPFSAGFSFIFYFSIVADVLLTHEWVNLIQMFFGLPTIMQSENI